ncbi:MAG: transglutaminase domain-containing protein [Bacillota bacterium]|nr:transglutaminase domain-containing protein [Bacillota bacterium]
MKKKIAWIKSFLICLVVTLVMLGAGYQVFTVENEKVLAGSIVEAALYEQIYQSDKQYSAGSEVNTSGIDQNELYEAIYLAKKTEPGLYKPAKVQIALTPDEEPEETAVKVSAAVETTSSPVTQGSNQNSESQPVETAGETPAATPMPSSGQDTSITVQAEAPVVTSSPVTYSWGSSRNYTYRMEVRVTNNGSDTSSNVRVSVPLLENNSPYQTTKLTSVNYSAVSNSGRVSTFNIGDLAPGESKTIRADFAITVRTFSINSTNDTVEKARQAYNQTAGSGNCRTLALAFISKSRELGVQAREVVGYARAQRGAMTSGSLQGSRHSWAEFYVDGLGWVPVDLTFKYFGNFPHTSHIIESYGDQSLKVNFTGGSLSASWSNAIL